MTWTAFELGPLYLKASMLTTTYSTSTIHQAKIKRKAESYDLNYLPKYLTGASYLECNFSYRVLLSALANLSGLNHILVR